ncbi:hypothetical protein ACFWWC_39150 [Streptomyces sp. NPDC058642]|uniref:hypothetical protein n=1 Tax=Streptomyces sp. NPDC058642 TaxID=3346572 RepID=UPI003649B655
MRIFVSAFGILAGLGLIIYSKKFARAATNQPNVFGRMNAAAGESTVRTGPLIVGLFLITKGVLAATGVVGVE